MSKVLLSIKPEYVQRILIGEKKFEFRKRLANKPVDTIVMYATSPVMKIVGEVKVKGVLENAPSVLWEQTKKNAGITRKKYREYFAGCKRAFAYELGEVVKYEKNFSLEEIGINHAPQSFVYLSDEQYEKCVSRRFLEAISKF